MNEDLVELINKAELLGADLSLCTGSDKESIIKQINLTVHKRLQDNTKKIQKDKTV